MSRDHGDYCFYISWQVDRRTVLSPSEDALGFTNASIRDSLRPFNLNESQTEAISSCLLLARTRHHKHSFKLIWGPPGTGKTKTVGILLRELQLLKCRTLTCAPTNTAVVQVVSRLLPLVEKDSARGVLPLGDIVLFGNKDRMKINDSLHQVFLDYHVKRLMGCFAPATGWRHWLNAMMDFFEHCISEYHNYVEDMKRKSTNMKVLTLQVFVQRLFRAIADKFVPCMEILCQHLPGASISEAGFRNLVMLLNLVQSFRKLIHMSVTERDLKEVFTNTEGSGNLTLQCINSHASNVGSTTIQLQQTRSQCLKIITTLQETLKLPLTTYKPSIQNFCLRNASLIFCTASSSSKLHSVRMMKPFKFLVIDEAAQLKECESLIPLLLTGLRHTVLIGDECQLPAMVQSKVCKKSVLHHVLSVIQ